MALPFIDERVIYRNVSHLRKLNETKLRELDKVVAIQGRDYDPIVVIIPIRIYNQIQKLVDEMKEEDSK